MRKLFLLFEENQDNPISTILYLQQLPAKTWMSQYKVGNHYDAHEFLLAFLDVIFPKCDKCASCTDCKLVRQCQNCTNCISCPSSMFSIKVKSEKHCQCPDAQPSIVYENLSHFKLCISNKGEKIQHLLDMMVGEQVPEEIEWRCNCIGQESETATKHDYVESIDGDVLFILVKIFGQDDRGRSRKLFPRIEIPTDLEFHGNWSLKSVIYHLGQGMNTGHYVTVVKSGDIWYTCDDERISPNRHHVHNGIPYIITYEKKRNLLCMETQQCVVSEKSPKPVLSSNPAKSPGHILKKEVVPDNCAPLVNIASSGRVVSESCVLDMHAPVVVAYPTSNAVPQTSADMAESSNKLRSVEDKNSVSESCVLDMHTPVVDVAPTSDAVPQASADMEERSNKLRSVEDKNSAELELRVTKHAIMCRNLNEVETCIRAYEDLTGTSFAIRSTKPKFGKDFNLQKERVRFHDLNDYDEGHRLENNGKPFVVVGKQLRECKHGPEHHNAQKQKAKLQKEAAKDADYGNTDNPGQIYSKTYKRYQTTQKGGCLSKLGVRHIVFFPEYELEGEYTARKAKSKSSELREAFANTSVQVKYEHCYQVQFPDLESHSDHLIGTIGRKFDQFICDEVRNQVKYYVENGVRSLNHMKVNIPLYVKDVLFKGKDPPEDTDRRYFPKDTDYRNIMYQHGGRIRLQRYDQDNMAELVNKWKTESPDDNFFFRGYGEVVDKKEKAKILSEAVKEIPPIVEPLVKIDKNVQAFVKKVCSEIAANNVGHTHLDVKEDDQIAYEKIVTSERLLFVHQTKEQRQLLKRYGNHLGLLDATWKTTQYEIPLFFLVVKTNDIYQVAASFVVQDETGVCIAEALRKIVEWNPRWDPNVFIVDNSNQEINAVRELFPRAIILLCAFHREQAWNRWLNASKNGLVQSKQEVLHLLRAVADSVDTPSLKSNLENLVNSDQWKKSAKLRKWFSTYWLPKYEMWVTAFRMNLLEIVVDTTNGVERINKEFKKSLGG